MCYVVKITINILCGLVLVCLSLCSSVQSKTVDSGVDSLSGNIPDSLKMKGISFVSTNSIASCDQFDLAIKKSGSEWVSLMPFGFCEKNGHSIKYNSKFQWEGERTDGISKYIDSAHKCGLKVLLKPQIWFWNAFTGDFTCSNEKEWVEFENSYLDYVLESARIAEKKDVEMLSIGTEWKSFVIARPQFWNRLIDSVEANYKGQLTYAANWDSYKYIPFWDRMDFIGIDAYFPLSDKKNATKKELLKRFGEINKVLAAFSDKNGSKKIIFTEYGWRSCAGLLNEPWNSDRSSDLDLKIQKTIYEAFYETTWNQDWFQGGFIWKWFPNHEQSGGEQNNRFTPQNKPVEKTIKLQYGS